MWLMQIQLHYVTRHFPEVFHVSRSAVDENIARCLTGSNNCRSVHLNRIENRMLGRESENISLTHLKPARTFSKVLFPAPDGP